jgi:putative methionine-R-sulfoxide reductase with GAF domain
MDKHRLTERQFSEGEGLIGQVFLDKTMQVLHTIPASYVYVNSGLGESKPASLLLIPLQYNQEIIGVMEIGSFYAFEAQDIDFMEKATENLAAAFLFMKNSQGIITN